ncbi:MAG: hypothetical protein RPU34_05295 [Candidatus Sedimenticola sp. (ex Thyasira tokunagai)]
MHNNSSTFPSAMSEVFAKLSSGYHICIEDGEIYRSLTENADYYRSLFNILGYRLSDGVDSTFYFLPTDEKISEHSKRFTAFMAIMYDWLADKGKEPVTSLTEEHFYLNQLPHLTVEQYKKVMYQLDVTGEKDLMKIVSGLQKLGFLILVDGSLIKFRKTVSRFLVMFTEVADRENAPHEEEEFDV